MILSFVTLSGGYVAKKARKTKGNPYYTRVITVLKDVVKSHTEQLTAIHRVKPNRAVKEALDGLAEANDVISGICQRLPTAQQPKGHGKRR
jgi:hypothetical protein